MSTTEAETISEGRESGLLHREFSADFSVGDGRTIDVRVVPYGEPTIVNDGHGAYREQFEQGAFDGQLDVAHRVFLNFEHQRGLQGIVGKGQAFRSASDGLYGTFRVLENSDGDKALQLVNERVLGCVSLEFLAKKSIRTVDGVVKRVKAHLDAVALCRRGAYENAVVLSVREAPIIDEKILPTELDPELIERCRRLGISLPQRYQRHPDETDTSAETDTSEDGTPLPENA